MTTTETQPIGLLAADIYQAAVELNAAVMGVNLKSEHESTLGSLSLICTEVAESLTRIGSDADKALAALEAA